jgi:virginiamycin B lyase
MRLQRGDSMKMSAFAVLNRAAAVPTLIAALALAGCAPAADPGNDAAAASNVTEYAIPYSPQEQAAASHGDMAHAGSTHEIVYDQRRNMLWISGQNHDALVRVRFDGAGVPHMAIAPMPPGSGPHGIAFDAADNRWVTLEYFGRIVAFDGNGATIFDQPVSLTCPTCPAPINSHPHGLGIGPDGRTIWFTGKATGTIGRITSDGEIRQFALPTPGSVPIYIHAGPDGNMWVTELAGNKIARIAPDGTPTEFNIPTPYARPISIVPGPDGNMWFSEEAGSKVARITPAGAITEYAVPRANPNQILAGLAFDAAGNLWVQQYVDPNVPTPGGRDNIIRIDRAGLAGAPAGLRPAHFTVYPVRSRDTVMHRIIAGPNGAMWFTEMRADRLGHISAGAAGR